MMVHPDQDGPNCKHSRMACRACAKLPLYVYGIDASIDNKILKTSHIILTHFAALDNGRNPDIGALKKERGYIFQNAAPKAFRKSYYVMSMQYYLKI